MRTKELHVVIGAGIAGCLSAIMRRRAGYDVVLLEAQRARSSGTYPVCTGSSNVVSENHSGAEYPFDPQTARDCLDGRIATERMFPDLIYGGKTYSRIIASREMVERGSDIVAQCRMNMAVIESHYAKRCAQDPVNAVLGEPGAICYETADTGGVGDAASVFVTPQRGINPVLVATVLEWELRQCGVHFFEDSAVVAVERQDGGSYRVAFRSADGVQDSLVADQVSFCLAANGPAMAKNLGITVPDLYLGLREMLCVDLPDGTDQRHTSLKLEDRYGGMFSPMSQTCALVYYPPAAHIETVALDRPSWRIPPAFQRGSHQDAPRRAEWALTAMREYYPELRRSKVLAVYLKVAVNTTQISRIRRNLGLLGNGAGCTMTILPKWTMCVQNAGAEVRAALAYSMSVGNLGAAEANALADEALVPLWTRPPSWAARPEELRARARCHAANLGVPMEFAEGFADHPVETIA